MGIGGWTVFEGDSEPVSGHPFVSEIFYLGIKQLHKFVTTNKRLHCVSTDIVNRTTIKPTYVIRQFPAVGIDVEAETTKQIISHNYVHSFSSKDTAFFRFFSRNCSQTLGFFSKTVRVLQINWPCFLFSLRYQSSVLLLLLLSIQLSSAIIHTLNGILCRTGEFHSLFNSFFFN